jgi:chemotaxis signal transduction protein
MLSAESAPTRTRAVLTFRIGSVWLGAPMEEVAGLVEAERLVSLPGQREPLEGVVAFRGDVVPTVDLPALLGIESRHGANDRLCAIILTRGFERFGMLIPTIPALIPAAELRMGEPSMADSRLQSITESLYNAGDRRIHCLEYWPLLDAVLPPAEATRGAHAS